MKTFDIHNWQKKYLKNSKTPKNRIDILGEGQIQSRNEFMGERYRIEYEPPKGYVAIGEAGMKNHISRQFFETYKEAEEHAQLEIDGFLNEETQDESENDSYSRLVKLLKEAIKQGKITHQDGQNNPASYEGSEGAEIGSLLEKVWNAFSTGNENDNSESGEIFK